MILAVFLAPALCWRARTMVASGIMNWLSASRAKVSNILANTPLSHHRRWRPCVALQCPYRPGRSRQGMAAPTFADASLYASAASRSAIRPLLPRSAAPCCSDNSMSASLSAAGAAAAAGQRHILVLVEVLDDLGQRSAKEAGSGTSSTMHPFSPRMFFTKRPLHGDGVGLPTTAVPRARPLTASIVHLGEAYLGNVGLFAFVLSPASGRSGERSPHRSVPRKTPLCQGSNF